MSEPKYTLDPMSVMWYPKINDVIGGWCITLDNKTAAFTAQAMPSDMVLTEQLAHHIARLHNQWLEAQ